MKKICYFTTENVSNDGAGVEYKINCQIKEFKNNGYEVGYCKYDIDRRGLRKLPANCILLNHSFNQKIINKLLSYDAIYTRYFLVDFNIIRILKKLKKIKPNLLIFMEIPTYPYDTEFSQKSPSLWLDKINRKKLYKYIDRIVTFSNDKEIYGIKTINVSNGVDIKKIQLKQFDNSNDKSINCIAVAKLAFWHGYDRIIEGLKQYKLENRKEQFKVYIVGDGDENLIEDWKSKVIEYNLENEVIFCGRRVEKELADIYSKCSIAFDSLGRHRSGVYYNSTLKGKEYLAKGLPIVSGVKTELDEIKDFKYYYRVPADDSPIDFNEILKFYHKIYDNNDKLLIAKEIRDFCLNNYTFSITFKKIINTLDNLLNEKESR